MDHKTKQVGTFRQVFRNGLKSKFRPYHDQSILVVEEEHTILSVLSEVLSIVELRCFLAPTKEHAVDLLERFPNKVFLALIDYKTSGYQPLMLKERICRLNKDARIVLTSGYPMSMISNEVEISELDGFIEKPINPSRLLTQLARAVGRRSVKDDGQDRDLESFQKKVEGNWRL